MTDTLWVESEDQVRLRVISTGTGKPLVFVPGWTMTAETWQGQFEVFASSYRVVSFDPRGQGQSGKPLHGYDSRHRAGDIQALIEQLHLEDVVLVAWSLGAVDALNYLLKFGSRHLRGLVLIDNSVDRNYASKLSDRWLLKKIRSLPYEAVIEEYVPSLFRKVLSEPERKAWVERSLQTPAFAAREALSKASTGAGLAEALRSTGLSALYMVTPELVGEGRGLADALGRQLQVEVFEKSGHALFIDQAQQFNQSLRSFLECLP